MNNKEIVKLINNSLKDLSFSNDKIGEAMKYTLVDDGAKRLRPLLFLLTYQMFNESISEPMNYALAIELIHNYSLVHDDLECMDNDDYRRGKLTVHKKYGEDIAVLVGDALLNYSFEVLSESIKNEVDAMCANYIVKKSGCFGMIRGQLLDIDSKISEDNIIEIYDKKTCNLLKASTVSAGILSKVDHTTLLKLENYAFNLGMAFQIIDDIMDYENDIKINKKTYVTIFGKEKGIYDANDYSQKAIDCIKDIHNSQPLIELTNKLLDRKY